MPKEPNYDILPEHIRSSVKSYIEDGVPVGSFLQAVICNDLTESFARADEINIARMFDIVLFFYNEAPLPCWRSKENMVAWTEAHKERREKEISNK